METIMEIKENMAKILEMPPKEIEIKAYYHFLKQELQQVELEIYKIYQHHGIHSIEDLDQSFKDGKIKEADGWEDYFKLDGLLQKQKKISELLKAF